MASPASPSELNVGRVQELRDALASKGLVLKDSILARFAKLKSPLISAGNGSPPPDSPQVNAHQPLLGSEANRSPDTATAVPQVSGTAKNDAKLQDTSSSTEEGRVFAINPITLHKEDENERKRRRAERFGTVCEDEKKKLRAARFGTSIATDTMKEDPEKLRARAARFGIVDEEAKKKARFERFNPVENEKMMARAARFALADGKALDVGDEG